MESNLRVSHIQLKTLIVTAIIGPGIVSLPNNLADVLGKDGWIPVLLTAILLIPVFIIINRIFKINPGKNYFQIGEDTLGKPAFTVCKLLLLSYLIVYCAFVARNLGELVKVFLLHTTPIEVIIFLFILTSIYLASMEIDIIVRAGYLLYPIILIFVAVFSVMSIPTGEITDILPLLRADFTNIPRGMTVAFASFIGFEVMIFALPFVEDKKKALCSGMSALGIVTFIYLLLFLITLTQFDLNQLQEQNHSLFVIAKTLDLPGYFLQNLDGIIMALWILVTFTTFIPSYFGAGKILSNIFGTKKHTHFLFVLLPVIYFISLIPKNYIQLQRNMVVVLNLLGFLSIVIIPSLIFIVGLRKRRIKS